MTSTLTRPADASAGPVADGPAGAAARAPRRSRGERVAFWSLLAGTALLYLWDLTVNGYSNEFYAAAVQAGSESWKAWFFGSLDASNAITVDKTPAALWLMGLSARVLGFSSFSMLLPQALLGVVSVAALYGSVRRWFGPAAGFVAGVVLALTPVAALMFRFNNPDALLVLLSVVAAYAVSRAIESPKRALRWMVLAGALVGFAFLSKMMQAFLVLPGFVAAYAVAARVSLGRRVLHLLAAFATMLVAAGWWILAVELWPAGSRPYIGGSQTNSILELTLGYNGLGRLNGDETGSVGGGGGAGGQWGTPGLTRLLGSEMGSQIAWLLPAALVALGVLVVVAGRAPRTDRTRAFALVWGGWLLVTGLTFSFMQGIIHSYYTVALAPAIGALVGAASVVLWRRRHELPARATMAGTTVLTAGTAFGLLSDTGTHGWVRWAVLVAGFAAAVLLLVGPDLAHGWARRTAVAAAGLVAVAALLGPATSAAATVAKANTGAIPSASAWSGSSTTRGGPGGGGGMGGFLGGNGTSGVTDEMVALLQEGDYTWAAAAVTANAAAPLQLASGEPVMAVGGFNGTDPSPTLAEFKALVADGQVHYFVTSGSNGRGGGMGQADSQIQTWVEQTFTATTVGTFTVYDLTSAS
ncbi:glycosyltransferase family 39 protein [Solicola sp. PLA-1-18]|uniref:glycosyltransferase family 39 protein n=1 Tax=Solicola sp. PLA-1-18 TaxID=3380532 RepID=UPI003B7BAF9D